MKNELPDIFEYIDYRKYLDDYYVKRKSIEADFTHEYICHRLGQENARSYFSNVINGRTDMTPVFIDRFINLLELKPDAAKYFRALVNYNQTVSPHEKEFFFDQLVRLNRTPHQVVDPNAYEFYKEWYHSAVRALLDIIDVQSDYKALSVKLYPPITLKQARDSIGLLDRLGLIKKNEKGFWKPTEKIIVTGDFIKDALVKQFQMKCLEHARFALARGPGQACKNLTLTASISDKAFERMMGRLKQLKTEFRSIIHTDEKQATKVYHLNVNFFPMSK